MPTRLARIVTIAVSELAGQFAAARRMPLLALGLALAALCGAVPIARATTASVSPDGNLLIDGEPVFPIGIHHVSWIGDRQGIKAVPDLHLAADAGFTLMHPTVDARDNMIDLLAAAAARGVLLIGEIPWPANGPDAFINKWKSHPAMIGWYLADDFNTPYAGPAYNHPPAEIAARHDHVRALAPGHVTHASGGSYPGFRIAEFAGLMDVMGFQSYPLGAQNHPDEYALQENVDSFDWVRDTCRRSRSRSHCPSRPSSYAAAPPAAGRATMRPVKALPSGSRAPTAEHSRQYREQRSRSDSDQRSRAMMARSSAFILARMRDPRPR